MLAEVVERAAVVDDDVGAGALFGERHLGGDAGAGFGLRPAVARHEALQLNVLGDGRNPDFVGKAIPSRLKKKRYIEYRNFCMLLFKSRETALRLGEEDGMGSAVEPLALGRVTKDNRPDGAAVKRAARLLQDAFAPMRDVKIPERLFRLHELMRHGVSVKDFRAEGFEDGGNGAFAAGDATGEADDFHTLSPSQIAFDKIAKFLPPTHSQCHEVNRQAPSRGGCQRS